MNTSKYRGGFFLLIVIMILSNKCIKTVIDPWPAPSTDITIPGQFTLTISNVSDISADLQWTTSSDGGGDKVMYEVALNDSVLAYDLEKNSYKIDDLIPDKQYVVKIIALDQNRNSNQATGEFRTMKSFVRSVLDFTGDFFKIIFEKAVKTSDNGVIIGGIFIENLAYDFRSFVMKLDDKNNVKWFHALNSRDVMNEIIECDDAGFLAVFQKSVLRLSSTGEALWNYTNPDKDPLAEIKCAAENINGNFVLSGISGRTWGTDISLQYSLFCLSSTGSELWYHFGGKSLISRPQNITFLSDGKIQVFGSAEYLGTEFDNLSWAKESYWILLADSEGNYLEQRFYPNAFSGDDVPCAIKPYSDNNYLLSGTAFGAMPPDYFRDAQPRFLKLSADGTILWDKYFYLNSNTGVSPKVRDLCPLEGNRYLVLTSDDRGIAISILSSSGEIEQHIRLDGFPQPVAMFIDSQGDYHCIMNSGLVIIFDQDGYHN